MTRRVVHFVESSVFGGAEQAVLTLMAGTDRSRWELVLVHHPWPGISPLVEGARRLGVDTISVPPMPPGPEGLRRVPPFTAKLRRLAPAVMHVHLTWPLGCQYAIAGAYVARIPARLATVQLYVDVELHFRERFQQRTLTRAVQRYVAVSEHVRRSLVSRLGWPGGKIDVVHNGVAACAVRCERDHRLRRELGGDAGAALILVPARLDPQKGHRHLLQAAAKVPKARFLLAGEGGERVALETLARDLAVTERVSFLGERRDVPDLLAASDLVVLPSLFEGLPLALLEAMAAGRRVIASRIGGVDEVVTSGRDGLLVPPGDPDALAGAIGELLDDPERAQALAHAARSTVEQRFSAAAMCERIDDLYERTLAP